MKRKIPFYFINRLIMHIVQSTPCDHDLGSGASIGGLATVGVSLYHTCGKCRRTSYCRGSHYTTPVVGHQTLRSAAVFSTRYEELVCQRKKIMIILHLCVWHTNLLATRVKKEQQSIVFFTKASSRRKIATGK